MQHRWWPYGAGLAGVLLAGGVFAAAHPAPAKPAATTPWTPGAVLPTAPVLRTVSNQPAALARGARATIVVGMATWCLYCGYEDRWVLPAIARTPGVAVDLVDLSPLGGIADPGPQTPAFHGHDGAGGPLTVAGMERTLRTYAQQYHLPPTVHLYVAPPAIQRAWAVSAFPTWAFADARGRVVRTPVGGIPVTTVEQALTAALGASS